MELSMDGKWQWNPLAAHWLDAYSLAYTVSSLLNQLFGKGKDPFWQQAYTNLVKWIIELYRIFPDRWVTLRDVYQCAINPDLFKEKIDEAGVVVYVQLHGEIVISDKDWKAHKDALLAFGSWNELEDGECKASKTPALKEWLQTEGIPYRITVPKSHTKLERLLARWQSVKTWYDHDWMKLDPKLRTSCVEGISSFLSLFDMEDVADIFCPQAPPVEDAAERPQWEPTEAGGIWKHLPPLDELIESGKVLALNMPAGSNPALARAVGVFLKNAWLQTLLRRPAQMKADTKRYFRPAVFICDEYQSFASVGEDDPSGDEKAFALTRQCRVIPIVATQSISSLRSVLGTSEAWRALLQTLRTRIFLSLSDDASASSPRNSAARWPESNRAGPSPNRRGKPKCRSCPARPGAARGRWEPASHSGNSGRLCFSPGSLPCFPIARRFACPMTAPTPQAPSVFISSRTTFRRRCPIGAPSRRGRYERGRSGGTRHGLPAPFLAGAGIGPRG